MDVTDAIRTRLEIRDYADERIDDETRRAILEAGRLAPSGKNRQHWRFVLVDDDDALRALSERSETGEWIDGADFAILLTTDPAHPWHEIDAGRAVSYMQFAAWAAGVGSCIFTGYDHDALRALFDVPDDRDVALVAGFGYPAREVRGRKSRKPLDEVAFLDRFGQPLD